MEKEPTREDTQAWDSASFMLDLSRFGVLDIRPKPKKEVELPPSSDLDALFVQQQDQLLHSPFVPVLLQRLRAAAPPRLRLHVCLGTVRYCRRLRLAGPRRTQMTVDYDLYLRYAVRTFLRDHIAGYDVDEPAPLQAVRWIPEEERTEARPHPFVAISNLKDMTQSVRSDESPPVLHVFQCMVDWPALLGARDSSTILNMPPPRANAVDGHAMLILIMSDFSQAYYFDPVGSSCIGSRYWRLRWEEALGLPLRDLIRTKKEGGAAWGPQVLPALLRQPNRQINISAQWCYAWCIMVTGLLVWNCCQEAADAEKIGAYLYAKRAKLQTLPIGDQAKYMDRKIRNFVLYMSEIQKVATPFVFPSDCASRRPRTRRRPPSAYPVADVYDDEIETEQFWKDIHSGEFTPVLQAYSVDDNENMPPPPTPGATIDARTPPQRPEPRRPTPRTALQTLQSGGDIPPSPAAECRLKLRRAWKGPAAPCLLCVLGARAVRLCPTDEDILPLPQPSPYVYVGGPENSMKAADAVAVLRCGADDDSVEWVAAEWAPAARDKNLPVFHLALAHHNGALAPPPPLSKPVPHSDSILQRCRTVKTDGEIACISHAVAVTRHALECVKAYVGRHWANRVPITEIEIAKVFELGAAKRGGGVAPLAFPSIVATGGHAVELHHAPTACAVPPGVPVVVDVGCRCRGYCADITVTLGCDKEPWRSLHDSLEKAVEAVVSGMRAGQTLDEVEAAGTTKMEEVCRDNGLPVSHLNRLMPHRCVHHLGLDVHDFCDDTMPLAPGMVLAVELGVYVPNETEYAPFPRGGVRVETDVVLEPSGMARVLL